MKRFQGEALSERPLIAVIANDALGNYVVSTPLLQMLKRQYPGCTVHYYSGTRTQELWESDALIDWGWPLHGRPPSESLRESQFTRWVDDPEDGSTTEYAYDLVINVEWSMWAKCFATLIADEESYVCGPALAPDGRGDWPFPEDERGDLWRDQEWISPELTQRYPFLNSGFIGEIFCRLAYLEGEVPGYAVPSAPPPVDVHDVLIATAASLPEKLWPVEKWTELVRELDRRGVSIGLIGAKPKEQKQFWQGGSGEEELVSLPSSRASLPGQGGEGLVEDLRGQLTLPEVVGALGRAKHVITLDNGILHLAVSTGTNTIGLYRHGIHRLWAPPYENLTVLTAEEGRAVADIGVHEVLGAL